MYIVTKHSPSYRLSNGEHVEMIGYDDNFESAVEVLRQHYLRTNQHIVKLSETMTVPQCILDLAKRNIERNSEIEITVDDRNIVFVDGQGPEMDYFMIREQ